MRGFGLCLLGFALALLLTACASPRQQATSPATDNWSGRLALNVQSDPPQSFSAGFELRGNAQAGELRLFTPLGSTVGVLKWNPGSASLERSGQVQTAASAQDLVRQLTGSGFPLEAVFDWLHQQALSAPGWQIDANEPEQGKLVLHRTDPAPGAELRIKLDNPLHASPV